MNINEHAKCYKSLSLFFLLPFLPRERLVASPALKGNVFAISTSRYRLKKCSCIHCFRNFTMKRQVPKLSSTIQGVPKKCATFVWLLRRSRRLSYLGFYIAAWVRLQLRVWDFARVNLTHGCWFMLEKRENKWLLHKQRFYRCPAVSKLTKFPDKWFWRRSKTFPNLFTGLPVFSIHKRGPSSF